MIEIEQLVIDIKNNLFNNLYQYDYLINKESIYKKIMALTWNSINYLNHDITQNQLDLIELICKYHNVEITPTPVLSVIRIDKKLMELYTKNYIVLETTDFDILHYSVMRNPNDMFHVFSISETFRYAQVEGEAKEKIPIKYIRYEKLKKLEKLNS